MAERGRPPTPTKLKIVRGNPGKRPLNKAEPQPAEGLPTRPEWLSPEGKREWTRIVTSLPPGLLTRVDRAFLAAWCQNWSDYVDARRDLEENGWDYVTEKGYQGSRPAVARMHKALEKLITLGGKLGLSPADRTRLTMPEKPKEDEFEVFLKGKHG